MSTPWVAFRLFLCYLVSSAVLAVAAWVFMGPKAFVIGPALILLSAMVLWFTLESRLIGFCRAVASPSPGLSHSYRRALEDAAIRGSPPELRVIPSPALQLLVARSFGGSGL